MLQPSARTAMHFVAAMRAVEGVEPLATGDLCVALAGLVPAQGARNEARSWYRLAACCVAGSQMRARHLESVALALMEHPKLLGRSRTERRAKGRRERIAMSDARLTAEMKRPDEPDALKGSTAWG
jgi:hypothetical protein